MHRRGGRKKAVCTYITSKKKGNTPSLSPKRKEKPPNLPIAFLHRKGGWQGSDKIMKGEKKKKGVLLMHCFDREKGGVNDTISLSNKKVVSSPLGKPGAGQRHQR